MNPPARSGERYLFDLREARIAQPQSLGVSWRLDGDLEPALPPGRNHPARTLSRSSPPAGSRDSRLGPLGSAVYSPSRSMTLGLSGSRSIAGSRARRAGA